MTYKITQKIQQAIPAIFGGGVRYRFVLTVFYPFGRLETKTLPDGEVVKEHIPEVDNITSDLTVDEGVFVMFEIGDRIHLNTVTAHE